MLSFKEKRGLQKVISQQNEILAGSPSFTEKRAAQKAKRDALNKLGIIPSANNVGKINNIENLVEIALSRKDGNKAFIEIGEVTVDVAEKVKSVTGIDVTGFVHAVDESAIRHVFEKHGDDKIELSRGQIAVTSEDILKLAEVVLSPDKIEQGDKVNTIEVSKRIGAEVLVVEEIRTGRKKLALVTMWKKPLAAHDAPLNESPAETPEADDKQAFSDDLSIDQPQEKSTDNLVDNSRFGLQASGIKTREKINTQVLAITAKIRAGKDPATLTSDEINLLKQYSGKGGLTINSQHEYYTPTHVAQGVWDALKINGFENGNVLEPSTGAGVFLATKPEGVIATGTEIDETSATVAQVLNPSDQVSNSSFELLAVNADDNSFDAVIGNVPFGNARGAAAHDDPAYKNEKLIERYFVQRVIDKVKPGGLICLIVPINIIGANGKTWEKFRIAISKKAEFLGGHKLPSKTFGKQGTDVVVDVLVMRKHGAEFLSRVDDLSFDSLTSANVVWAEFVEGRYWQGEGKKFIKGEFVPKDPAKFRDSDKVIAGENMTDEALKRSLAVKFDSRIDWAALDAVEPIIRNYSEGDTKSINGMDYTLKDGQWQKVVYDTQKTELDTGIYGVSSIEGLQGLLSSDVGVLSLSWGNIAATIRAFPNLVPLHVKDALRFSEEQPPEHQWRAFRGAVIGAKIEGYLNNGGDTSELEELKEIILHEVVTYGHPKDISGGLFLAGNEAKRLGMFINSIDAEGNFSALIETGQLKTEAEDFNSKDVTSIIAYLFERNQDPVELETILSMYEGDTRLEDLGDISEIPGIAVSPDGFIWPFEQYCSGDVYPKMRAMRDAMLDEKDKRLVNAYKRQIERIDAKLNKTSTEDINFNMRHKWFDAKYVLEFLQSNGYGRTISYNEELKQWKATGVTGGVVKQIVNYLNNEPIAGGVKAAEYKDNIRALEEQFNAFMQAHAESEELTQQFNEAFNSFVPFDYSASSLELKNVSGKIDPHGYQNEAVRRLSREGVGILGFDVGLGKSFSSLALQAYNEQMGRAKRSCITVPDSVLANWYHEHKIFYKDTSNMLFVGVSPKKDKDGNIVQERVLDEKGNPKQDKNGQDLYQDVLSKDDRETIWNKMHSIPSSSFSLVVMTHPQFGKIPVKPKTKLEYADAMMSRELLSQSEADKLMSDNKLTYEQAKQKDRLEGKYSDEGTVKQDAYPFFEDMAFDSVIVDEAHAFKNSFTPGKESSRIAYLPTPSPSQRAIDMSLKMAHIRNVNGGKGPILLSATPVTNSPLEIYNMLSLMIPMEEFERFGVYTPDDFIRVFGRVEQIEKMKVSGDFGSVDAMVGFQNLDGLRSLFHKYAIIKNAEDVKLPLPDAEEVEATVELSDEQQDIYQELRTEAKKASSPDAKVRESARPLFSIIRDMDRTTTDLDLYHKKITFVFDKAHNDALQNAIAMLPKTVQRSEYDSDLEKNVTVTVDFEYEVEEKDGKIIVRMTDAGEDDMVSAIQKVGIPENEVAHPITPKYAELVNNLKAELEVGGKQIIFTEEKTQHNKLARILVHFLPITLENIGIINADAAAGEKLQRISDAYNSGKIVIIIANKKAEVGVNLQKGTTAIHHLTFPWVPASMQQRNGRGVRQGNTVEKVRIYHYIGKGSFDMFRLNLINQKGNWINDILSGSESAVENKGDGHMSTEDIMALLSDNPEEYRARIQEQKAKREAKKKEKSEKAMVISLKQLSEARKKLGLLQGWKDDEHKKLTEDLAKNNEAINAFNDDGSEESKTKLLGLKNRVANIARKLDTLDSKYQAIEDATTATIKQKTVFLKAKAASGELPFEASAIDNPDTALITNEGIVINVGKVYEFKCQLVIYTNSRLEGLCLIKEVDNKDKVITVRQKNRDYDDKLKITDLTSYKLVSVAMSKDDFDVAAMLSKPMSLPKLFEVGKETFDKHRQYILFERGLSYISYIDGEYGVLTLGYGSDNKIPDDFVFPDVNNEAIKQAVAKYYFNGNKSYTFERDVLTLFFGSDWKTVINQYANITNEEDALSKADYEINKMADVKNVTAIEFVGQFGYTGSLADSITSLINGDNKFQIRDWVLKLLNDYKSKYVEQERAKQVAQEQEKLKSDPDYKEIPSDLLDKLKSVGITAKYNPTSLRTRALNPSFSLVLFQDKNGKNGLLFKAKEDLKSYYGAQFGNELGQGFSGAWWYMSASKDINKIVATILGEQQAGTKTKPDKLIVPVGKVKVGQEVSGYTVTNLGKSWEAKDYHISKVKADSGFDIEEGDLIQYARFD